MGGSEPGENTVEETALSRKQAEILKERERFTQEFTIPELREQLESAKALELSNDFQKTPQTLFASRDIGNIRSQFDFAENQLTTNLAKRGLEGSGVEVQTLSQLAGAEAAQVGNRINQATLAGNQERNLFIEQQNRNQLSKNAVHGQALGGLINMAPRPTGSGPTQMGMTAGQDSPLGATVTGGMQGAQIGAQTGNPYAAIAGGIIGAGTGYASAT